MWSSGLEIADELMSAVGDHLARYRLGFFFACFGGGSFLV